MKMGSRDRLLKKLLHTVTAIYLEPWATYCKCLELGVNLGAGTSNLCAHHCVGEPIPKLIRNQQTKGHLRFQGKPEKQGDHYCCCVYMFIYVVVLKAKEKHIKNKEKENLLGVL